VSGHTERVPGRCLAESRRPHDGGG
jgi:hypothetical protein